MTSPLIAKFEDAIGQYRQNYEADEWHFVRLQDDIINQLEPPEAFELIGQAVELLLRPQNYFARYELGSLLDALVGRSGTTEMPPVLEKEWAHVVATLTGVPGAIPPFHERLERWYRR